MSTRFSNVARRLPALAAIALVALVSSAIGAYAAHSFSDVPDTHPFHDEIAWMAEKGISTGFDDGTYRPASVVTRQAMAAFMQRLSAASPLEWEPNDTIAAADIFPQTEIVPGTSIGQSMGSLLSIDNDFWRITHPGGGYLQAVTYGLDCADQNRSNVDLFLYDANGTEIAQGNNSNFGDFCASLFIQPLDAGDYFMRVDSPGNVPWYGLNIQVSNFET